MKNIYSTPNLTLVSMCIEEVITVSVEDMSAPDASFNGIDDKML